MGLVKRLGPAWTDKGRRAPPGYLTRGRQRRSPRDADGRRQGSLAVAAKKSGVTFAEAAAEWLRDLREDREREPSTLADYQGVVKG